MHIRHHTFTIFVVIGNLLFSGCGDKNPSEADFKKEANAACKTYNEKAEELQAKLEAAASNPQELAKLVSEQETTFATLISDLQKVDAPKKQKANFKKLIDQTSSSKELMFKAKAAVQSKDLAMIQQAATLSSAKTQAAVKRLSSSLGLDECGKSKTYSRQ